MISSYSLVKRFTRARCPWPAWLSAMAVAAAIVGGTARPVRSQDGESTSRAAGSESPPAIDEQLLEDLAPPETAPAAQPTDAQAPGEDLGQPPEARPLDRVLGHMRAAQQHLAAGDTSLTTQQQQQATEQLAQLIASAQKRMQQSGPQRRQARAHGQSNDEEEPAEGDPNSEGDPSGRSGAGNQSQAEQPGRAQSRSEEAWGHLPERVRQQLRSAAIERFLPKYEELIEQYYRRLAEEPEASSRSASPAP